MSIDKQGFLSPEIMQWIERHRTTNKTWFTLATELNEIAHALLGAINIQGGDNQSFVGALLYMRGLSNFQGALLLAERGLTQEARSLTRGIFETAFFLGAAYKAPEQTINALIGDDSRRRTKIARALTKNTAGSGLEPHQIDKLNEFVSTQTKLIENPQEFSVYEAARLAGVTEIYDTFYRALSNDAAHPSITSLNRHVEANEQQEVIGLKWGPDVSDVQDTVSSACTACIYLIAYGSNLFGRDRVAARLDAAWEEYKRLIGAA